MEGFDLDALRAELEAVQLEDTIHKISERNCVDIVLKLKRLGQLEVFFTLDAKEYVTPEQLDKEIQHEIKQNGGRIDLIELQPLLNVDAGHIRDRVEQLVSTTPDIWMLQSGEIVTKKHILDICGEIQDYLAETGTVKIGELAARFQLPFEFLRTQIQESLGSALVAHMHDSTLSTEQYIAGQRAKIRGAFSGATAPTSFATCSSRFQLDIKMIRRVVKELIDTGVLSGSVLSDTFHPAIFLLAQRQTVDTFFSRNGYIEKRQLADLEIEDAVAFVRSNFSDSKETESCLVSAEIVDRLDASVAAVGQGEGWLHAATVLPACFSNSDINSLLHICRSMKKVPWKHGAAISGAVYCVGEVFLVSDAFFAGLVAKVEKKSEEIAQTEKIVVADQDAVSVVSTSSAKAAPIRASKKGKKKVSSKGSRGATKRKGKRFAVESDEEEGEEPVEEEVRGKKAGRRRKREPQKEAAVATTVTSTRLMEWIKEWYPEMDDLLMDALTEDLWRTAEQIYRSVRGRVMAGRLRGEVLWRRKVLESAIEAFAPLWQDLQLFWKGLDCFSFQRNESASQAALNGELEATIGARVFSCLLYYTCSVNELPFGVKEGVDVTAPVERETQLRIIEGLPRGEGSALNAVRKALKDGRGFQKELELAVQAVGLPHHADKRKERARLFSLRQELLSSLENVSDPALLLWKVCVILFEKGTLTAFQHTHSALPVQRQAAEGLVPTIRELMQRLQTFPSVQASLAPLESLFAAVKTGEPVNEDSISEVLATVGKE